LNQYRRILKRLAQIEIGLAVVVSVLAVALHFQAATHMGGIWRDEANSIEIDSLPNYADVWHNIKSDSFPVLWHVALKSWLDLGFTDDASLRLFGFLIGVLTIGALWVNARVFNFTSPLIALVLLEMNPTIVRWGDSIRGHGLGLLLLIGIPGSIWFLLKQPTWQRFLIALALCLLAVQSEYYSAILLLAAGTAAMMVGGICRQFRGVLMVGGVGFLCALSLLVYASVLGGADETNKLHQALPGELTVGWYLGHVTDAIGPLWGVLDALIWLGLFLFAVIITAQARFKSQAPKSLDGSIGIYFLLSLVICFLGYFFFLKALQWRTNDWYYIPLMGFMALAIEGMLVSVRQKGIAIARVAIAVALIGLWFPWAWSNLELRLTNIDLVVKAIDSLAHDGDYIVINPWNDYISFQRYDKGRIPWNTMPAMSARRFSDLIELRQIMMANDQNAAVAPVFREIAAALHRGNRVWIVGSFDLPPPGRMPFTLPPAPNGPTGWQENPYYGMWSQDLGYFLRLHGLRGGPVDVSSKLRICPFEDVGLIGVEGWHD
jgi:hypothetical protein